MARNVKGSALAVGDVIQDQARTGDTHPFLVVARTQWQITLRNCTSHETSALTLVKVLKGDKTGDPGWAGKDSFVVKSGGTVDLSAYDVYMEETGEYDDVPVAVGPPVLMQFMGPQGPYYDYAQPTQVMSVPRLVERYSDAIYRVVGTVVASRMDKLLSELA